MKRYLLLAFTATMLAFISASAFAASNAVSDDTYQEKLSSDPGSMSSVDLDHNQDGKVSASASSASNDVSDDTYQEKLNSDPGSMTYLDLDHNQDGKVSESEFRDYYAQSGIYDSWDVNGDSSIDNKEFVDVLYVYYDDNGDGFIDDAEWQNGVMVDDYGENGFWDN